MRWFFFVWDSDWFWIYAPFPVAFAIAVVTNFFTLWFANKIFDEAPELIEEWFGAFMYAMGQAWCVQDPIIIIVRNNLSATKTIIRSNKYQFVQAFTVAVAKKIHAAAKAAFM